MCRSHKRDIVVRQKTPERGSSGEPPGAHEEAVHPLVCLKAGLDEALIGGRTWGPAGARASVGVGVNRPGGCEFFGIGGGRIEPSGQHEFDLAPGDRGMAAQRAAGAFGAGQHQDRRKKRQYPRRRRAVRSMVSAHHDT